MKLKHLSVLSLFMALFVSHAMSQTPEMIFHSGFQPGTTIVPGNNPTHNIDIIGIDNSVAPPNNWVGDLEGHPNMGGTRILFQNGNATTRNAEIVQDPDPSNPGNKVMNWWIKVPNSNNGRGRIQFSTYGNNNLTNVSYSVRLYLSEDIAAFRTRNQQLYGFMLSEFWNNAGFGDDLDYSFSIHLSLRKVGAEPGPLVFKLSSRTKNPPGPGPGWTELWGETNRDFEIPTSKWMTLKYHFIEGNASTGRFFVSVTPDGEPETVVFDINNFTHHPDDPSPDGLRDFNPLKLYVGGNDVNYLTNSGKLLSVYWDDFELWRDQPYPNGGTSLDLIERGSSWKYLDNGSNQGTAWQAPAFDDSAWASGAAQLGYGDGDEATVVSFGPNASSKYTTTYFRHTFNVADASQVTALNLELLRDDGAVIYLNGTEITRSNMPQNGAISYTTLATAAVSGTGENTYYASAIPPTLLVTGSNTLAVEVHQYTKSSSDMSFDAALTTTQGLIFADNFE